MKTIEELVQERVSEILYLRKLQSRLKSMIEERDELDDQIRFLERDILRKSSVISGPDAYLADLVNEELKKLNEREADTAYSDQG